LTHTEMQAPMAQPDSTPLRARNPGNGGGYAYPTYPTSYPTSPHRRVIMRPEQGEDEEILDADNFQDIRMELAATGHNLTSVLINPRETYLENFFDEFAAEQSAPLEYASPLGSTR
jgi:hypothetical protein